MLTSSPILSPRAAPLGAASIDASLARGIRRTYFRELEGQWKRLKKARTRMGELARLVSIYVSFFFEDIYAVEPGHRALR